MSEETAERALVQGDLRSIEELFTYLQKSAHLVATANGFHTDPAALSDAAWAYRAGARLALIHSEVSEALEEIRKAQAAEDFGLRWENGKPEGVVVELADTVIRILDFCEEYKLELGPALIQKMIFNSGRREREGARHGGKAL